MAKTWSITQPQVLQDFSSAIEVVPPASGATYINGAFVSLSAGQLVATATAAATFFGIAMGPASYAAGIGPNITDRTPVFRARAGQRVYINIDSGGSAANNPAVGTQCGIKIEANGIAAFDYTNTTEKVFELIQYASPLDQVENQMGFQTDINPRVLVEILAGAVQ